MKLRNAIFVLIMPVLILSACASVPVSAPEFNMQTRNSNITGLSIEFGKPEWESTVFGSGIRSFPVTINKWYRHARSCRLDKELHHI